MKQKTRWTRIAGWALFSLLALYLATGAVAAIWGGAEYLWYIATRSDVFDAWAVLSILTVVAGVVGLVGAGFWIWRRRMAYAAAFLALTIPAPMIIEASRCDWYGCAPITWAALHPEMLAWQVRLREADADAAEGIAFNTLRLSYMPYTAAAPRREGRIWRLETRTDQDVRGPHDVLVDARTGRAAVVRAGAPASLLR
ncbi:MAG: hypothetical protein QM608_07420 [Caulobacter sp.]